MRKEWYLVSLFLAAAAAVVLYQTFGVVDTDVRSVPQTAVQTVPESSRSRYAVNLNEASFDELMGVRGMTETIANGILERRAEFGRFFSVDELLDVSGVGEVTLEKLRPYVCVE